MIAVLTASPTAFVRPQLLSGIFRARRVGVRVASCLRIGDSVATRAVAQECGAVTS